MGVSHDFAGTIPVFPTLYSETLCLFIAGQGAGKALALNLNCENVQFSGKFSEGDDFGLIEDEADGTGEPAGKG